MKIALKANLICLVSFLVSFSLMSHIPSELTLDLVNPSPGSSTSQGESTRPQTEAEKQKAKAVRIIRTNGCWNDDSKERPFPSRVVYSDVEGKTKIGGEAQVSRALEVLFEDKAAPGPKYSPYAFCK